MRWTRIRTAVIRTGEYDVEDNDTVGTAQQASLPVTFIGFVRASDDPDDFYEISPDEDLRHRFLLASFTTQAEMYFLYISAYGQTSYAKLAWPFRRLRAWAVVLTASDQTTT